MKLLILEQNEEEVLRVQELCREVCDLEKVFAAATAFEEMSALVASNTYDILILNVDSELEAILQFLEEGLDSHTSIILTSKENNSMIKVFNHSISGFISKPFIIEEFRFTINRVKKKHALRQQMIEDEYGHFKKFIKDGLINRIALTTLDGYVIVHYDDIIRCEANGNYTSVYFNDGSFLMLTKTLKHYASKLEDHGFFRVHKTHLVNLKFIRSYVKGKNSYVELKDGSSVEVSSRKKQNLVEILNK